jgi:hypothetical protein
LSPEVRERAERKVFEHEQEYGSQWSAIGSIAQKIARHLRCFRRFLDRLI